MTDLFEYIPLDQIESLGGPIVHVICADHVQKFAESNCDYPLTDDEMKELPWAFAESWDMDFMHEAISRIRPRMRDHADQERT